MRYFNCVYCGGALKFNMIKCPYCRTPQVNMHNIKFGDLNLLLPSKEIETVFALNLDVTWKQKPFLMSTLVRGKKSITMTQDLDYYPSTQDRICAYKKGVQENIVFSLDGVTNKEGAMCTLTPIN